MGLSLRNIGRKITDIFDANSAQDQTNRLAAGQPRMYADQQKAAPVRTPMLAPNRSNVSRVWDQVNPLDNNRTYKQALPTTQRSSLNQIGRDLNTGAFGVARSSVGIANDLSGFADLITPGVGTNRFTNATRGLNENIDRGVKLRNMSTGGYKAAQGVHQAASFLVPGAIASRVGEVPKVARGIEVLSDVASKIPGGARVAEAAANGNKVAKVAKWVTSPTQLLNVGSDAAQGAGFRTARGQDNSPATVATDVGTSLLLAGGLHLGGKGLNAATQKAVVGLRDKGIMRPSNLNDAEVADLLRFKQQSGGMMEDGVYEKGIAAGQKAGIDMHPTSSDAYNLIKAHQTYNVRKEYAVQDKLRSEPAGGRKTSNEPTIINALGQEVDNPHYVAPQVGKTDPNANMNNALDEVTKLRKSFGNDEKFYNDFVLANQEAGGKLGELARSIARTDAKEGGKSYPISAILDDHLAPIDTVAEKASIATSYNQDLKATIRDLEKSTGQKGLYQKVAKEMQGMTEQQQTDYMAKSLTDMRQKGVLAADFINKERGTTPPSATPAPQVGKTDKPKVGLKKNEKDLLARVAYKEGTEKALKAEILKFRVKEATNGGLSPGDRIKEALLVEQLTGVKQPIGAQTPPPTTKPKVIKNPLNLPEANTQSMPTPLGKSKYAMSSSGLLDNMGVAGKEFNKRFDIARSTSEQGQAAFWKSVPAVKDLKGEFKDFVAALDSLDKGQTPNMTPKVAQAVAEYTKAMPEIRKAAVAAGKEVGDRGQYYFPRDYGSAFEPKNLNKTVQKLIDSKQATSVEDAMQKIEYMRQNSNPIYGHLDKTRSFDLPGYNNKMDALTNYVSAAHDNIARADQFGPNHENISQLVNHMSKEGYDTRIAQDAIDVSMGDKKYNPTTAKWLARVRQFQGMTKLGKAGVTNAGQSANTAMTEGAINTLRSVKQLRDKNVLGLIEDSGVLNDHTISKVASGSQGVKGTVATNLASPGFTQIERFNRMVAGQAGKNSADILAKKAFAGNGTAELKLRSKYGITGDIGETLTREQQIQAIRKTVEKTQFKVDGFDLPPWANSPLGKSATQFKPFMYKQTKFLMDEVIKAAKNDKDLMPMVRMLTVGAPIGVGGMYIKGAIAGYNPFVDQKTQEEDSTINKIAKGVNAVGGTGMASIPIDLYNKRASDSLTSRVAGTIGGPGLSDVVETSQNVVAGNKNKDWKPLTRQTLTKIPVIGNRISNAVAPYSEQPSSQPKKGETATPAQLDKQASDQLKQMKLDVKAGDNGLVQLPNGKYALTMNGEVTTKNTLEEARNAARLDHALADGSTSKVLGDKHYYKNEEGDTKAEPLYKYEYDKVNAQTSLDMYVAKDNEDYKGWTTAADTKMKALIKKRNGYNKDGQEDEVDKTQKEIEQLKHDMKKYAGYGGAFSKGRGSSIHASNYHVSLNAGGSAPRVTSATSAGQNKMSVSFKNGSSKPRVTSKKSRV